jgi:flavoprotein
MITTDVPYDILANVPYEVDLLFKAVSSLYNRQGLSLVTTKNGNSCKFFCQYHTIVHQYQLHVKLVLQDIMNDRIVHQYQVLFLPEAR